MKNKQRIVYVVENLKTGEKYVGATSKTLNDRRKEHLYKSNSTGPSKFQRAIYSYGPKAFSWKVVARARTDDELALLEKEYIQNLDTIINGYNVDSGGGLKKTVYQYNISTGALINDYPSLQTAAMAVKASTRSISSACCGQRLSCKGYYWTYSHTKSVPYLEDKRKKGVLQLSLQGQLIQYYESVSEASKATGINSSNISRVCRGERKQTGGFCWKYLY